MGWEKRRLQRSVPEVVSGACARLMKSGGVAPRGGGFALSLFGGLLVTMQANAACGINSPGNFTAPVLCVQPGNANMTLTGPSTVTISNITGTQDAIRSEVTGNSGSATATLSDVIVINNDTTYPSIGIYVLVSTFTTSTGNGTLNLSGVNDVTTANGTTVEVNVRGTGSATMNIDGTLNVTSLVTNTDDNDGLEITTHHGGAATLNMGNASGIVSVKGGNGILIDSLASGGVISGTIGQGMTVNLDNTIAGNNGALRPNSGIYVSTQATGTIDLTTGAAINTLGARADGIRGNAVRGTVDINNSGNINTTGNASRGIEIATVAGPMGPGGAITVNNSGMINTFGADSAGIQANSTDGNLVVTNSGAVTTRGLLAHGIQAITANAGNSAITTTNAISANGQFSIGALSLGNATNITVASGGGITGGWQVGTTDLGTSGLPSTGVALGSNGGGATLLNNGAISALSDRAVAELDFYGLGTAGPLSIVNNGNITGYLRLGAGDSTFHNLSPNSFDIRDFADTNGDGMRDTKRVAVSQFGTGNDTFINAVDGVVRLAPIAGAVTTDPTGYHVPTTGSDNRELEAGFYDFTREGLLQGQLTELETFDNTGTIDLRGTLTGNTLVITGGPGVIGTLQPGNGVFVANGGQLLVNTRLNEGIPPDGQTNSYSDMLIVDSTRLGLAPTSINVTIDSASAGALTPGNGIEIVEVRDKSASADGVFALGGRVASGAYEYLLFHNGVGGDGADGNWYLRSTLVPTPPEPPVPPEPPLPPEPEVPNYRPEVPLDTVLPALAQNLGLGMLGTYHGRFGDDYPDPAAPIEPIFCKDPARNYRCTPTPEQTAVYVGQASGRMAAWGRIFGETGEVDHGRSVGSPDRFLDHGPNYESKIRGIQAGMDLLRTQREDGSRDIAGFYIGYGRATADVDGVYGGYAGSAEVDAYSLGGYWTHLGPSGWYIDMVLQGTRYDQANTNSVLGENLDTNGWGIAASLEAGYPFILAEGWTLEPQAQIVYQHVRLDDGADNFGQISFGNSDALYGRLGARLTRNWLTRNNRHMSGWVYTNVWSSFGEQADTTFSSLSGGNPVTFSTDLGGTWGSVGLGLSAEVADNVRVFASGDYNIGFDGGDSWSVGGRAGLKVTW